METATILSPAGDGTVFLAGKPEQHESNSLPSARLLAAAWSRAGAFWRAEKLTQEEQKLKPWIDVYLIRHDGKRVCAPVTRVVAGSTLKRVAMDKEILEPANVNEAVEDIWKAFEAKSSVASDDVLLLLDGRQPRHPLRRTDYERIP